MTAKKLSEKQRNFLQNYRKVFGRDYREDLKVVRKACQVVSKICGTALAPKEGK